MKKFFKQYYLDFLILGGILLLITNHFFKFTEYSSVTELNIWKEYDTIVKYDYVGFIASVFIAIGLYILIRKYFEKN